MVVEYRQADGTVQVRGYQMPDGPLSQATGQMVAGWHSKCFYVAKKREARGDQVTGRILTDAPTGYSIGELVLNREDLDALGLTLEQARERSTVALSAQVNKLRDLARSIGKGVGDAHVQEAFAAQEHGGPYPHEHHHKLDAYQLIAHLHYAHGAPRRGLRLSLEDEHTLAHRQDRIAADRRRDDEPESVSRDWRIQFTAEIE